MTTTALVLISNFRLTISTTIHQIVSPTRHTGPRVNPFSTIVIIGPHRDHIGILVVRQTTKMISTTTSHFISGQHSNITNSTGKKFSTMWDSLTNLFNCVNLVQKYKQQRHLQLKQEVEDQKTLDTLVTQCPLVVLQYHQTRNKKLRQKALDNYEESTMENMGAKAKEFMELTASFSLQQCTTCEDLMNLLDQHES